MKTFLQGKEVISYLAEIYNQLYLDPHAEDAEENYNAIVRRGESAPTRELSHFILADDDKIETAFPAFCFT